MSCINVTLLHFKFTTFRWQKSQIIMLTTGANKFVLPQGSMVHTQTHCLPKIKKSMHECMYVSVEIHLLL